MRISFTLFVYCFMFAAPLLGVSYHYAIIGDAGEWNSKTQKIHKSIEATGVTRLILPGDNLYKVDEGYASAWLPWMGFSFDAVAIGNHNMSYAEEVAFFKMPGEYYAKVEPGVVRFLILNSDNEKTVAEQAAWLEEELQKATEPFVFPVYHHPSYTISIYHYWREKKAFHEAIRPLLFKYRHKITAVINGHDHMASLVEFDNLPVVVSGATSDLRPTLPVNKKSSGTRVRTRWLDSTAVYWAHLELDADKGVALVHFRRGRDNQVKCTARLNEKKVFLFSMCEEPEGSPEQRIEQ